MLRIASLLLSVLAFGFAQAAEPSSKEVVAPRSPVAGVDQSEWSVRWWQWAASFDDDESPILDRTGASCASKQTDKVWFLAGVYGSAPVKRACTIPRGRHLFFPIVNYMVQSLPDQVMTCPEMTYLAKQLTDEAANLTLIIDDVEFNDLAAFRQVPSDCFNLLERIGDTREAAANGYFVMLKPLKPGRHIIKWGGKLASIRQGVIYEITVP